METKTRIVWVDNVKVLAFILVALGHMLMGLFDAGVLTEKNYPAGFVDILYMFHVPLFFICSGFLYEKLNAPAGNKGYAKNLLKKLITLGIPYFVFSLAAFLIKALFSGSVTHQNGAGILRVLFVEPAAPYWFLYALFLLFLVSPLFLNKADAVIRLTVAAFIYVIFYSYDFSFLPEIAELFLKYICSFLFYFTLGMGIAYFSLTRYFKKSGILLFVLFLAFAAAKLIFKINFPGCGLILGTLACTGIISFIGKCFENRENPKVLAFLYRYSMPVFLMHSIFAAGVRTALIKIGVMNPAIHIAAGLIACFALPIAAGIIMEKIRLDILYQPSKYIKIK